MRPIILIVLAGRNEGKMRRSYSAIILLIMTALSFTVLVSGIGVTVGTLEQPL